MEGLSDGGLLLYILSIEVGEGGRGVAMILRRNGHTRLRFIDIQEQLRRFAVTLYSCSLGFFQRMLYWSGYVTTTSPVS